MRIFRLQKLDCLKVVAPFSILARLKSFYKYGLHRHNNCFDIDAERLFGQAPILPYRKHAKPRESTPTSVKSIEGVLKEPFAQALIRHAPDINNPLVVVKKINALLFSKIYCGRANLLLAEDTWLRDP